MPMVELNATARNTAPTWRSQPIVPLRLGCIFILLDAMRNILFNFAPMRYFFAFILTATVASTIATRAVPGLGLAAASTGVFWPRRRRRRDHNNYRPHNHRRRNRRRNHRRSRRRSRGVRVAGCGRDIGQNLAR